MSAPINDGGPAFSRDAYQDSTRRIIIQRGMSLRAWLAGQALAGMDHAVERAEAVGEWAVSAADATLKALREMNHSPERTMADAAPELLAALEAIVAHAADPAISDDTDGMLRAARAVIAKAKGEQP